MKKDIFRILIAGFMSTALLTGCGSSVDNSNETSDAEVSTDVEISTENPISEESATEELSTSEETKSDGDEIQAYENLLTDTYFNWNESDDSDWESDSASKTSEYKFAYEDLNGDGIKELILECDAASHMSGYYRILVYTDGEVKIADSLSDFSWYKDAGMYEKTYSNQGHFSGKYNELSANGEITERMAYEGQDSKPSNTVIAHVQEGDGWKLYYTSYRVDGEEVSYEEYESALNNLNLLEASKIIMLKNTEENRQKYAVGDVGKDYILPDSDSKFLTSDDLQDFSQSELRLARNEIYARHGRRFNDSTLQSYFDDCSWYQGTIDPEQFDESVLNE